MLKKILFGVLLGGLLLGVLFGVDKCGGDSDRMVIDSLLLDIEVKKLRLDSIQARHDAFRDSVRKDTAETNHALKAGRMRISALEGKLRRINLTKASPKQLDSVRVVLAPETSDTVYCMPITSARSVIADAAMKRIQDTLLVAQASHIEGLEQANENLSSYMAQNDSIWQAKDTAKDGIIQNQNVVIQTYKKKERRAAFKSWLEKVGAVAAGVLIGLLISN
jgi:hypothetical protein